MLDVEQIDSYPLIGFRSWLVVYNKLCPITRKSAHWVQGENTAHCFKKCREAPGKKCHCGLNAFFSNQDNTYQSEETISGVIAGAGRIEIHAHGFRAEKAQILCLYLHPDFYKKQEELVYEVAKEYQVPVFQEEQEMIDFARKQGIYTPEYRNYFKDKPELLKDNWKGMIWKPDSANDQPFEIDGRKEWCQNGLLHRDRDLPAREWEDGTREWWFEGKRHRDGDEPAIERADGSREWYQKDELHRDGDLPAREKADGTREWYQHGECHRDGDKPAREYADGSREWWKQGTRHRDGDLPAVEYSDGSQEWYQNGKLHRDGDKPAWECANGTRAWWQNDKRHRDGDKPAWEGADGTRGWYQNGKRHRDGDKPAIERADGTRVWYRHGKLHRQEKPKEG